MVRNGPRRKATGTVTDIFDEQRAAYTAAKGSRFRRRRTGYRSQGTGADWHYRIELDWLRMVEYARDFDRNDVIVGQMTDRAVDNEVQDGFKLDPCPIPENPENANSQAVKDIAKEIKDWWEDWAGDPEKCDIQGESTFNDFEHTVSRAAKVDGDMIGVGISSDNDLIDGRLQHFEAHRCRTPFNAVRSKSPKNQAVFHGIRLNQFRRRIEYWITHEDLDPNQALNRISDVKKVSVRDGLGNRQVFHPRTSKRQISQTRGITAFAPIFDLLSMVEDINFAKLVQQQIVSCFAIFKMRNEYWEGEDGPNSDQLGERRTQQREDGTFETIEGISPGMLLRGEKGEVLQGFSPNVPNEEFFMHFKLMLTLVSINLGMPLVLSIMDASETNFSGWRGSVDQARIGFRKNQRRLARTYHSPVYKWKLRQKLADDAGFRERVRAAGIDPAGEGILAHKWNPPSWPYLEPFKDAKADDVRLSRAQTSRRRVHAERGRGPETDNEIIQDNGALIRMAKTEADAINTEFNDDSPVTWIDVLNPLGATADDGSVEEETANKETRDATA